MSAPPANASSSLTSPTSAASSRIPPDARPASSPTLARKSTLPPQLRLDSWSPLISTTATNTSTNAAYNPSHAFVFTSSRTLRSLHNCSGHSDESREPLPATDPIQPNSFTAVQPPLVAPPSPSSPSRSSRRPTLSSAQLARHSSGAVDARCIVSPNMRAAGFVPLYNQQSDGAAPPTPNPSVAPTPINPPRFPPIVFVNPTNVAHTSMWEYQRTLSYGLATEYPAGLGSDPGQVVDLSRGPGIRPLAREDPRVGDSIAASGSVSTVPSTSSSGLFSRINPPKSSMSSFSMSPAGTFDTHRSVHERLEAMAIRDSPPDGYPFPETPPKSRPRSKDVPDIVKKSPSVSSSTASGSITPLAASPLSSPTSPPASLETSSGSGSTPSGRDSLSPIPSRPHTGRARSGSQLSITQLCEVSPTSWFAHSNLVAPQSSPSMQQSSASGKRGARRAESKAMEGREEINVQAGAGSLEIGRAVDVPFEKVYGEKAVTKEALDGEDLVAREKRQDKHRGREKDRARDKEKKRERCHHERKASTKSHTSSSPTSSTPSPGRKGKGPAHFKPRDRTRSTKEKALGSSYPNTFTTSFATFGPSHSASRVPARPHMLGDPDPALDRERERDAGFFAKDDVFVRRERDREHARQTEHGHGKHKKHASTVGLSTGPLTMAYDAGRGRGIGRGQRPGMRGRSVSSSFSIFSETGTMVDSVAEEPLQALEASS